MLFGRYPVRQRECREFPCSIILMRPTAQGSVFQMVSSDAHPPETLEGWYALHQIYTCATHETKQGDTVVAAAHALTPSLAVDDGKGWSACIRLIGSLADLMVVHFRPTLDAIGEVQQAVASPAGD